MFPPEEIAAARRRETERSAIQARRIADVIEGSLRAIDGILTTTAVPGEPHTIGVELEDGSLFTVTVRSKDG
jgi:hypothetical protein